MSMKTQRRFSMKTLLLLTLILGASFFAGCDCASASKYPHDTFIGSSGWPASQRPITAPVAP
jgi:hypothetical protein